MTFVLFSNFKLTCKQKKKMEKKKKKTLYVLKFKKKRGKKKLPWNAPTNLQEGKKGASKVGE
jgi:hypothetical protein